MAIDPDILQAMSVLYIYGCTPLDYADFIRMQKMNGH